MRVVPALALVLATQISFQPTAAAELAGVAMPDTMDIAGQPLVLNGMGLRKVWFVRVYVAGLYLQTKSADSESIINQDKVKHVTLHMLRKAEGTGIGRAIVRGFKRNSLDNMPSLQDRLNRLCELFPSVRENDVISLTYSPEMGTTIRLNGKSLGVIQGKDFAAALFAVWLGTNPVHSGLKAGMLNR